MEKDLPQGMICPICKENLSPKKELMKKNLAYNALLNTVYRLLNVIFPFITATYVSRVLAPAGVGKVAYAQNIISYFLMFAVMGIPEYGTREIAKVRDDEKKVSRLFCELVSINTLSTALCVVVYYGFIGLVFPKDFSFYAVLGMELILNFLNIDWMYQGNEDYLYITVRSIGVKVLSLIALFVLVKDASDYLFYGVVHCMGLGFNHVLNVLHLRKRIHYTHQNLNLRQHMQPILVLMVSAITASLYSKVDMTMLGWMSTDAVVGYYSNAHKLMNIVLTLVTALSGAFLPRLSYVYVNDRKRYSEYVTLGLRLVLLLALPSCAGIWIIADDLTLCMFGEAFLPSAATIRILSSLTIIKGIGDILCYQSAISSGNEKLLIKSRVIAGITNIILNAWLIPKYQHNGAAVASVISELIVNGMILPQSIKIAHPKPGNHFLVSTMTATAVMVVCVLCVQHFLHHALIRMIVAVTCGMLCYGAVLLFTRNDVLAYLHSSLKQRKAVHNH